MCSPLFSGKRNNTIEYQYLYTHYFGSFLFLKISSVGLVLLSPRKAHSTPSVASTPPGRLTGQQELKKIFNIALVSSCASAVSTKIQRFKSTNARIFCCCKYCITESSMTFFSYGTSSIFFNEMRQRRPCREIRQRRVKQW